MIPTIWTWLTSAQNWVGSFGIGNRLAQHVGYSLLVVAIAAVIAIPSACGSGTRGAAAGWCRPPMRLARCRPWVCSSRWPCGSGRTSPDGRPSSYRPSSPSSCSRSRRSSRAHMPGWKPLIPPPATRQGIGMTPRQVLARVELPCALPLLWSGLRSAVLQVIATATIAAYIGLGGLGRFLIDGLAQADYAQTAGGAILVCLLALVADGVLALVQRVIVSPGVSGRRRRRREIILAPGKDMGHGNVAHTTSA